VLTFARLFFHTIILLILSVGHTAAQGEDNRLSYVGSQVCADCHAVEFQAWQLSHHARAMLEAKRETVLAPFGGEAVEADGFVSTFFRREGKFFVNTIGPDGAPADFEVGYTFGFAPLQQYLIAIPGGRFQAFFLAWDSRPKAEGGQRWFDLYPDDELAPGNPLHWTGIDQNWNYQCAWCHSTDLRKNYDAQADTFATTWSEINVGCEACHGRASAHIAWAGENAAHNGPINEAKGFALSFDEREGVTWEMGDSGIVKRSEPRKTSKEIDMCAGCHARRGQFAEDYPRTGNFLDSFRPALIEPGLYHADGQQLEEVYKWGSFLQSKMHAQGVTCSDCHDPHSGKTMLEGNTVCGQCHQPEIFDTAEHHYHEPGSAGAECASCHMPTTNYMVVDPRHDHSFRIPRPELTAEFGIPNACNQCHTEENARWAVAALDTWHPRRKAGFQDFAELFAASDRGLPGSREALVGYLQTDQPPPIVTASALQRLARQPSQDSLRRAAELLGSSDALVRSAAIRVVEQAEPQTRLALLTPRLGDASRLVRMDAARALTGDPESQMDAVTRERFQAALTEYIAAQQFNAERPEANANLANLYLDRGNLAQAGQYFETALERDASFIPATIGLARVRRLQGDERAAQTLLREASAAHPQSPDLAHSLGLSLVRGGEREEALQWLRKAARLGQDNPRFAYVYAVALHDMDRGGEAIAVLKTMLLRHRYNRNLLSVLLDYQIEVADWPGALQSAERLAQLEPGNSELRNLITQLRQQQ
jgi:Flp pilus assembly protein TadD